MLPDGALILVTGANGFVGSHLAEALLARGYRVRCMVRRSGDLAFIRTLPVEWAYADVRQGEALRQACRGVDAVCHCAALTRAIDRDTFMRVNAEGTAALAQACAAVNPTLRRFLYVSSQAAAGPARTATSPTEEAEPPHPVTWYGESKLAGEEALRGDAAGPAQVTIIRPSAVLGPRDRDFYRYFQLVKWRLTLALGRQERRVSLIYVRDLVRLVVLALESEAAAGQTYFGCGPATSYSELAGAIGRALDKRPVQITLPEALLTPIAVWGKVQGRLTGRPALLNDQRIIDLRQPYWLCSGDKARRELGFSAEFDLDAAVRETAAWYKHNKWL